MNIREVLLNILHERFLIPLDKLNEKNWNIPLTGKLFGLTGFELAELILELEKRIEVQIDIHEKPMYALGSINDIVKSIEG